MRPGPLLLSSCRRGGAGRVRAIEEADLIAAPWRVRRGPAGPGSSHVARCPSRGRRDHESDMPSRPNARSGRRWRASFTDWRMTADLVAELAAPSEHAHVLVIAHGCSTDPWSSSF